MQGVQVVRVVPHCCTGQQPIVGSAEASLCFAEVPCLPAARNLAHVLAEFHLAAVWITASQYCWPQGSVPFLFVVVELVAVLLVVCPDQSGAKLRESVLKQIRRTGWRMTSQPALCQARSEAPASSRFYFMVKLCTMLGMHRKTASVWDRAPCAFACLQ